MAASVVEGAAEDGEPVVEVPAHRGTLAPLSAEQKGELSPGYDSPDDGSFMGDRMASRDGIECIGELDPTLDDENGAMVEVRTAGGERVGDVEQLEFGVLLDMVA